MYKIKITNTEILVIYNDIVEYRFSNASFNISNSIVDNETNEELITFYCPFLVIYAVNH